MRKLSGLAGPAAICVAFLLASHLQAEVVGSIWENDPSSDNADIVPGGTPDAQFITAGIDYDSDVSGYTIGAFLGNPTFFNTSATFNPSDTLEDVFIQFVGTTFLHAGDNTFDVEHDDGVLLTFPGLTPSVVLDVPGPTGAEVSPFTVNAPAAGEYDFTLNYTECCGAPGVLNFQINDAPVGQAPEPASVILCGIGLVGFVTSRRLRTKR